MRPIIQVENLSKEYRIGAKQAQYATLRDSLANAAKAPFRFLRGNGASEQNTIWALKDVSFEVMPGEVVGVIGRNGAGKSTLLKVISRITEPTRGAVDLYGRVGSLLEVGTGFHAELSGRENIYLNGAILGMSKAEIDRKFDEIVEFAEVSKFIDTSVKHYSSGMYLRLAFAVASHLDTNILLLDEVLAVGDYAFQRKCLERAGSVAADGRTVLLVSHNLSVLGDIAKTAIWLDSGRVANIGPIRDVVGSYLASTTLFSGKWESESPPEGATAYVRSIKVVQLGQDAGSELAIDCPFDIELEYEVLKPMKFCRVGVLVYNSMGLTMFSTAEPDDPSVSPFGRLPGSYRSKCTVPGWLLSPDTYLLTAHIDDAPLHRLFTAEMACSIRIAETAPRGVSHPGRPGVISPVLPWSVSCSSRNGAGAAEVIAAPLSGLQRDGSPPSHTIEN